MGKFNYRMQNILNLKYKLEEQQKMNLTSARIKLSEEEDKLKVLYKRKKEYEEELRRIASKKIDITQLRKIRENCDLIDYYIIEQKKQVKRAESVVELEEEKMIEAMKERKIQEKLREISYKNFLKEEAHVESVMIDELVSYAYTMNED